MESQGRRGNLNSGAMSIMVPVIRPYTLGDAPLLYAAARESIAELSPWMPWATGSYAIEDSVAYLQSLQELAANELSYDFAVIDRDSGTYLGGCGINQINRRYNFANLGYWVRTSATRHGVASAATRLVARFAFELLHLNRVEIVMDVRNVASRRAAEKAGATFEGVMRNRLLLNGDPRLAAMFSLIPADLAVRR
jgi:ribosomal-protein-serine acetyltransferase